MMRAWRTGEVLSCKVDYTCRFSVNFIVFVDYKITFSMKDQSHVLNGTKVLGICSICDFS